MAFFSNSLSFPSEAPGIGNWFGSYKYESLKDSELKGYVFEEEEPGNSSLDGSSTAAKEKCRIQGELGPDQVPDPVSSDSILSEPPPLNDWFSSYVYESPVFCTVDDDYNKSKVNDKKIEEYASVFEECETEGEENIPQQRNGNLSASKNLGLDQPVDQMMLLEEACGNKLLDKISDASQSQTVSLSELPDLRNWFSSYVYDSPVLGESDTFVHEQVESKEEDLPEEENFEEKPMYIPGAVVEDHNQENGLANMGNGMAGKEIQHSYMHCKMKGSEFRSLESDTSTLTMKVDSLSTKSNTKSFHKFRDTAQTESNDNGSSEARRKRVRKNDNDDKENRSDRTPGDGFVTTRKNRRPASEIRQSRRHQGFLRECTRANKPTLLEISADVTAKRTTLSERTNLEHHSAVAVPGKWHCPQKNKPVIGPPLKQLRLEQWIHRI